MTTEEVLAEVEARGLKVLFREDGTPYLRGPRDEVTEALLRVLKRHRERIVETLAPGLLERLRATPEPQPDAAAPGQAPPATAEAPAPCVPSPRRVVLLDASGGVERVFDVDPRAQHGRLRELARQYPGRTLAGEWRTVRYDGRESWVRFVTIRWPEGHPPEDPGEVAP